MRANGELDDPDAPTGILGLLAAPLRGLGALCGISGRPKAGEGGAAGDVLATLEGIDLLPAPTASRGTT